MALWVDMHVLREESGHGSDEGQVRKQLADLWRPSSCLFLGMPLSVRSVHCVGCGDSRWQKQIRYVVVSDPTAEEARANDSNGGGGGGGHPGGKARGMDEDDEDEDEAAGQAGDGEAQTMLESYVIGMITNHKQLPLVRFGCMYSGLP